MHCDQCGIPLKDDEVIVLSATTPRASLVQVVCGASCLFDRVAAAQAWWLKNRAQ